MDQSDGVLFCAAGGSTRAKTSLSEEFHSVVFNIANVM